MMNLFKRKRSDLKDFEIEQVKVDGHKFKVFTNPLKMPYKRILQYFIAVEVVRIGIGREDQQAFKEAMRHEINQGQWSKVTGLFEHFVSFTDLYVAEKYLMQVGVSFIMLNGEDPHDPKESDHQKKLDLCDKSEEVRAFFLSRSYNSLKKSVGFKEDFNISGYLKDPTVKKAALTFLKLIHSRRYKK